MKYLVTVIFTYLCLYTSVYAKVTPPNYDFSLKKFDLFYPGSKLSDIQKKYKYKEIVFNEGNFKTYKFFIKHIRYNFAILVQFNNSVVTDFHARLPQYFLHNIFHQALINRLGTQDIYKKTEEQAVYIWKNIKNNKHYYAGGCTITCFPIYYGVIQLGNKALGEFKSIIDRLQASERNNVKIKKN